MHPGARALVDAGRFAEAAALLEEAIAALHQGNAHPFRETPPAFGPEAAALFEELGTVHWHLAHHNAAAAALRRAREIREAAGEPETALATVIERQAALAHHLGDDDAAPLFDRAIAARVALHGEDSLEAAVTRRNFGAFLRDHGPVPRARRVLEAALIALVRRAGTRHPDTAAAQKALALCLLRAGQDSKAIGLGESALDVCMALYPPQHPFLGGALLTIGVARRHRGSWREAAECIGRAETLFAEGYGDDHPLVALAVAAMADLAVAAREIDQASELFTEAVRIYAMTYENHPFLADLLQRAARPLQGFNRWAEALAPLRRAMQILEPLGARTLQRRRVLAFDLARTYGRLGHDEEAREWVRRAARLGEDDSVLL